MTGDELLAGIKADFDALEQVVSLVIEFHWRVSLIEDARGDVELGVRAALAHQKRLELAELGVDLNLPVLSALIAATVARTPDSSGAATADPQPTTETPSPSVPLDSDPIEYFTTAPAPDEAEPAEDGADAPAHEATGDAA